MKDLILKRENEELQFAWDRLKVAIMRFKAAAKQKIEIRIGFDERFEMGVHDVCAAVVVYDGRFGLGYFFVMVVSLLEIVSLSDDQIYKKICDNFQTFLYGTGERYVVIN